MGVTSCASRRVIQTYRMTFAKQTEKMAYGIMLQFPLTLETARKRFFTLTLLRFMKYG